MKGLPDQFKKPHWELHFHWHLEGTNSTGRTVSNKEEIISTNSQNCGPKLTIIEFSNYYSKETIWN